MILTPTSLRTFPWSTYGRRESGEDFWKKVNEQKNRIPLLSKKPLVSLVVWLDASNSLQEVEISLDSLRLQSYPNWEAIVVGSVAQLRQADVRRLADSRIKWKRVTGVVNSAQIKQEGSTYAEGEWLAFLNAGSVLSPAGLYDFMVASLKQDVELLYCNTVELANKGPASFISRNEFSWFTLVHLNHVGNFFLVKRPLFEAAQGFSSDSYPSEDHVFLLKLSELTQRWKLLPAFHHYTKRATVPSGGEWVTALGAHLQRKGFAAEISLNKNRVTIQPKMEESGAKLISVVVCFKDKVDWTLKCLKCLSEQVGNIRVEVILVNNNSNSSELSKLKEQITSFPFPIRLIDYEGPFNFGHMHNVAIRKHAHGDFVFVLNNDVFLSGVGNLDRLAAWTQFDWVGTVGLLLRYQHGGVQHSGFNARFGGEARLVRLGNSNVADRFAFENHEVYGNTFAACMFRKSTYETLGGFRELDIPNGFGDVSFNFDCLKRGLHNLYLGQIEGVHLESASRGLSYEYWEECLIEREYPEILEKMLRLDLGVNRVPMDDHRILQFVFEALKAKLRTSAPWLKPLKDRLRKVKFQLVSRRFETA